MKGLTKKPNGPIQKPLHPRITPPRTIHRKNPPKIPKRPMPTNARLTLFIKNRLLPPSQVRQLNLNIILIRSDKSTQITLLSFTSLPLRLQRCHRQNALRDHQERSEETIEGDEAEIGERYD